MAELSLYLKHCDANYSANLGLLGGRWQGVGYHSRMMDGTWVHELRASLEYALALLTAGEAVERAQTIIRQVLRLQDTDPTSATYGIWPWLHEEPLAHMEPPDWNWADFCGALLAQILCLHSECLTPDLYSEVRASLGHAAWSIFRRNVGPHYTNIAIMGAGVALAAGELLDERRLRDYGRQRLDRFLAYTLEQGGFNEYNSPTYTLVALHECERLLMLVQDPAARATAEQLHDLIWGVIAASFHPPTAQWAGPHSRTYSDYLSVRAVRYLSQATGVPITPHPQAPDDSLRVPHLVQMLPCPARYRERFRRLLQTPLELKRRFIKGNNDASSLYGTTYLDAELCLASVTSESLWVQRRGLLAYWRTEDDPAVVLRLRCLKDGRDFAAAAAQHAQTGVRVLSATAFRADGGDYHLHLDRSADGRFSLQDLRFRYELRGKGVKAQQITESLYELSAGDYRALLHPLPAHFGDMPILWQAYEEPGCVALDAVLYHGSLVTLEPVALPLRLTAGLELLPIGHPPSAPPTAALQDGVWRIHWAAAGLTLEHRP